MRWKGRKVLCRIWKYQQIFLIFHLTYFLLISLLQELDKDVANLGRLPNCLPACTSIHYDCEISQSPLNLIEYYKETNSFDRDDAKYSYWNLFVNLSNWKVFVCSYVSAHVKIYFKRDHFIESKRFELFGWVNFLSNCGGFLGHLNTLFKSWIIKVINSRLAYGRIAVVTCRDCLSFPSEKIFPKR